MNAIAELDEVMGKKKKPTSRVRPASSRSGRPFLLYIETANAEALNRLIKSKEFPPALTAVINRAIAEYATREGFPPK